MLSLTALHTAKDPGKKYALAYCNGGAVILLPNVSNDPRLITTFLQSGTYALVMTNF